MNKVCNQCNISLDISFFHKDKTKHDGYYTICKSCRKINAVNNIISIRKYQYKYYNENRNKLIEKSKKYYKTNKYKENRKIYLSLPDVIIKRRNYRNKYRAIRIKTDINFRLKETIRSRIKQAIRMDYSTKSKKTLDLLGCTISELKIYLESKFQPGMNWYNHGLYGWHIDHIIPCSIFDLTDPVEQKQCFHYTNLQPLWAKDNLDKRVTDGVI